MPRYLRIFCLGVVLCFMLHTVQAQMLIPRSVMGCGGNSSLNNLHQIHGTVSQAAIGRVTVNSGESHDIGYWYTVQRTFLANRYAALIVVPGSHAAPGEKLILPLLLQQSKNLNISSAKNFTATLRFNATLLEPVDKRNYRRTNDTGWVQIQGSVTDSAGILAQVEFLAKLGNNEDTPVSIESFAFLESSLVRITTKDGIFSLDGVCREGGEIRLIKSIKATALAIFPNPIQHQATIQAHLTERGMTEVYMLDLSGRTVAQVYYQEAAPGSLQLRLDATDIPNGSYFLMMRTPNELFSQRVIIEK